MMHLTNTKKKYAQLRCSFMNIQHYNLVSEKDGYSLVIYLDPSLEKFVLLTFMDYPSSIRSVIYTTNAIERTIKEIRKRLKPMNSLSSLEAAEKIVYLTIQDFNEKWAGRKLRGFAEAHEALERMLEERYH